MSRFSLFLGCLVGALLLVSCDSTDSLEHTPQYVVEGYLQANGPLQQVRVSQTEDINAQYDFTALSIRDAAVEVQLLTPDGNGVEATFAYRHNPLEFGVYLPDGPVHRVLPLRTYRLVVTVGEDRITSETLVPGDFELLDVSRDEAIYQSFPQIEFTVTRSFYPTRQTVFVFTSETLDPLDFDNLTPFYRDVFDPDTTQTPEDEIGQFVLNPSPPLNEGNYIVSDDGATVAVPLTWIAIAFYGRNKVTASAIDDNMYDFLRSQQIQQGGSTLAPGEIPNVLDRVQGGLGVFGSYASVSADVTILR